MKQYLRRNKLLISIITGLSGLVGGTSIGAYNLVVEKTKIIAKVEAHDKYIVSTDAAIKEINEAIQTIRIDIAVLKNSVSSSHTPTQ